MSSTGSKQRQGKRDQPDRSGTPERPDYHGGYEHVDGDVWVYGQTFSYRTGQELVAGATLSTRFTVDRPTRDVWPYLKDFNLWQAPAGYRYTGVVGDLEGKTFRLEADDTDIVPPESTVLKVIPEFMIVTSQGVPEGSSYVGLGGIPAGFHVLTLNNHAGTTIVSYMGEHASVMARGADADTMTIEEALLPWHEAIKSAGDVWREKFIPAAKQLGSDG